MTFTELSVPGVWRIDADVFPDERGTFVRAWMFEELTARGLDTRLAQCSLAENRLRGTIRGLHYQIAPFAETKIVRVVRGAIFDIAVDLRPASPTYRQWTGLELSAANRCAMYVPEGVAHGYQTLADDTDVLYFVSTPYVPEYQRGARWDDPAFGIVWPLGAPTLTSRRDRSFSDFVADPAVPAAGGPAR